MSRFLSLLLVLVLATSAFALRATDGVRATAGVQTDYSTPALSWTQYFPIYLAIDGGNPNRIRNIGSLGSQCDAIDNSGILVDVSSLDGINARMIHFPTSTAYLGFNHTCAAAYGAISNSFTPASNVGALLFVNLIDYAYTAAVGTNNTIFGPVYTGPGTPWGIGVSSVGSGSWTGTAVTGTETISATATTLNMRQWTSVFYNYLPNFGTGAAAVLHDNSGTFYAGTASQAVDFSRSDTVLRMMPGQDAYVYEVAVSDRSQFPALDSCRVCSCGIRGLLCSAFRDTWFDKGRNPLCGACTLPAPNAKPSWAP